MDFNSRVKIFVFSHFTMPTNTYSTRVSSIVNTQEILGHPNKGICLIGEGGGNKGVEEAERSSSTSVTGVGVRSRSKSNGVGDRRERSTLDLLGVGGGGVSSSSLLLFGSISIISGGNWISSKSSPNTSWSVGGTGISSGSGRGGGGGISSDSGRGGGGG